MIGVREAIESPVVQGKDERLVWTFDISNWGSSPTGLSFYLFDTTTGQDVTATKSTGSPAVVSPTLVNTPVIHSLTSGTHYRAEVRFTANGQVWEPFFEIIAED